MGNLKDFIDKEVSNIHKQTILESKKYVKKNILESDGDAEKKSYMRNVYEDFEKDMGDIIKNLADVCDKLETSITKQDVFLDKIPNVQDRVHYGEGAKESLINIYKNTKFIKLKAEKKLYGDFE
jgi:hypothetical protein